MGWEKILDILSWLKDKLPIQNRIERYKNELDKLEKEREKLLQNPATTERAIRLVHIDNRIEYYRGLLKNVSDSK